MKKFIVLLLLFFIPICSYCQNKKESSKEDVVITINISKLGRAAESIISSVKDEVELTKTEIEENLPEERKEKIRNIPKKGKELLKGIHDEFHRGLRQGLRGEKYNPNKE